MRNCGYGNGRYRCLSRNERYEFRHASGCQGSRGRRRPFPGRGHRSFPSPLCCTRPRPVRNNGRYRALCHQTRSCVPRIEYDEAGSIDHPRKHCTDHGSHRHRRQAALKPSSARADLIPAPHGHISSAWNDGRFRSAALQETARQNCRALCHQTRSCVPRIEYDEAGSIDHPRKHCTDHGSHRHRRQAALKPSSARADLIPAPHGHISSAWNDGRFRSAALQETARQNCRSMEEGSSCLQQGWEQVSQSERVGVA